MVSGTRTLGLKITMQERWDVIVSQPGSQLVQNPDVFHKCTQTVQMWPQHILSGLRKSELGVCGYSKSLAGFVCSVPKFSQYRENWESKIIRFEVPFSSDSGIRQNSSRYVSSMGLSHYLAYSIKSMIAESDNYGSCAGKILESIILDFRQATVLYLEQKQKLQASLTDY